MHHIMARFWWILFLRGILGLALGLEALWMISALEWSAEDIFGLSALLRPGQIWATLVFLLGLYALLDGLFAVVLGSQDYGGGRRWWALVTEGIFSVALGFLAWLRPGPTLMVLLYWIALWALVTGFLEMGQGLRGTEYRDRRSPFFYAGLISAAFGVSILLPGVNGMTLIWLIGLYAFLFSVPLLTLGLHLRRFAPGHLKAVVF